MSTTTLFTFIIHLPSRPQKVDIYGSWDNFTNAYPLKKDTQKGSGHWTGCHAFNICERNVPSSISARMQGGLKQGGTYWYFYRINDHDQYCDPFAPSTSRCPYLPGRPVNILEVPIEQPESSQAELSLMMSNDESVAMKKAQLKHKMLRPLFSRKRPGSAASAPVDERRERVRSEWLTKAVGRLCKGVDGAEQVEGQSQEKLGQQEALTVHASQPSYEGQATHSVEDEQIAGAGAGDARPSHLRQMSSAPSVLPSGALLSSTNSSTNSAAGQQADDSTHSIRESLGTLSLTSASTVSMTAENTSFQTPQITQSTFEEQQQSPPSLYCSATTSLDATPMSMVETPQALHAHPTHAACELPGVNILNSCLNTPSSTSNQPLTLAQPQAYSRHTLGAPFETIMTPSPTQQADDNQNAFNFNFNFNFDKKLHQHDSESTLHPFFTQGARVSLHAGAVQSPLSEHDRVHPILSRVPTEPDNEHSEIYAHGLSLFRQPLPVPAAQQEMTMEGQAWQGDEGENEMVVPTYEIDLEAVNKKLLGVECVTRRREEEGFDGGEWGYLGGVIC